jgi:hypothetical protein
MSTSLARHATHFEIDACCSVGGRAGLEPHLQWVMEIPRLTQGLAALNAWMSLNRCSYLLLSFRRSHTCGQPTASQSALRVHTPFQLPWPGRAGGDWIMR